MATLEQIQLAERNSIEILSQRLQPIKDLKELIHVIEQFKQIHKIDPLPHLKNAMANYVKTKT